MYEVTQFSEPVISTGYPGLVQIGTIRFPRLAKCSRCKKTGVEMVIIENGKNTPYHRGCLDRQDELAEAV